METKTLLIRAWAWLLILLLAVPPGVIAQQPAASATFKQEELDQIVAPIALHPDSPWPLQPEEKAIIPDGDTRDSRQWKRPGGS